MKVLEQYKIRAKMNGFFIKDKNGKIVKDENGSTEGDFEAFINEYIPVLESQILTTSTRE